jgi:hypothetical protein
MGSMAACRDGRKPPFSLQMVQAPRDGVRESRDGVVSERLANSRTPDHLDGAGVHQETAEHGRYWRHATTLSAGVARTAAPYTMPRRHGEDAAGSHGCQHRREDTDTSGEQASGTR